VTCAAADKVGVAGSGVAMNPGARRWAPIGGAMHASFIAGFWILILAAKCTWCRQDEVSAVQVGPIVSNWQSPVGRFVSS
jgi:hypothetical protein